MIVYEYIKDVEKLLILYMEDIKKIESILDIIKAIINTIYKKRKQ